MKAVVEIELVPRYGELVAREVVSGNTQMWARATEDDVKLGLQAEDNKYSPDLARYTGTIKFLRWEI